MLLRITFVCEYSESTPNRTVEYPQTLPIYASLFPETRRFSKFNIRNGKFLSSISSMPTFSAFSL